MCITTKVKSRWDKKLLSIPIPNDEIEAVIKPPNQKKAQGQMNSLQNSTTPLKLFHKYYSNYSTK